MNKKKTPKRKAQKKRQVTYTHRDASGMPWRFVGGAPVSWLADKVMRDCGFPLR